MTITTRTIISFKVPDEHQKAMEFEASNPDWRKDESSAWINYKHEDTYFVNTKDVEQK